MQAARFARRFQVRQSHGLVVPYTHNPFTQFVNGVPAEQVRELTQYEKQWEFWTTSTAFYSTVPKTTGLTTVPAGEVWIVERGGKFSRALTAGSQFLFPVFDKIKTVKLSTTVLSGVLAPSVTTKSGKAVDAYAVLYYNVTNPATSAYFVDPETNLQDSERAAAKTARKVLAQEVAKLQSETLTDAEKQNIAAVIQSALKAKSSDYGLEFTHVEVRGAFPVESSVSDKIRALEPPHPDFDAPGHDLPNDYWAPLLTPAFFEKMTYGSAKAPKTPAAVSLEWNIPSPPDFHHFNEIPKLTANPAESAAPKVAGSH
ncbi:hypothetical protein EDD86DRAFT_199705 [Gorgonomyces haynaldii]|nr:hypothetical protein EDD86DRAFT_199705 [Gorgonomyces haynaldii]